MNIPNLDTKVSILEVAKAAHFLINHEGNTGPEYELALHEVVQLLLGGPGTASVNLREKSVTVYFDR